MIQARGIRRLRIKIMKINIAGFILFLLTAGFCLAGCGTPPLYNWGDFQLMIYKNLKNETGAEPQISALEKNLSGDKPVPPGFYAHLGMLYAETGDLARAVECFNEEKTRFPESAVFMDRLLSRIGN